MYRVRGGRARGRVVGSAAALVTALVTLAGCGPAPVAPAPTPAATAPAAPAPAATAPAATPAPPVPVATAPAADPGPTSWRMPDLVGSGLQDAQDAIQALTGDRVFVTRSHDASGAGRHQILDRDWKVCDQNVRPGATITAGTSIDFGAVKLSERCGRAVGS